MIEVPVDFNVRERGGQVVAALRRFDQEPRVGDPVLAVAYEDEMVYKATIASVEGKSVYLDVDWSRNLYDAPSATSGHVTVTWSSVGSNRVRYANVATPATRKGLAPTG